uniref:DedD protein n=1 Tax=Candidatus Kentrum sp. LFY TaxID=2126342 RepID=A0A450UJ79_9GAMM|nr:MAG: DedD protein [Candidatus Kentron sp. LFY]
MEKELKYRIVGASVLVLFGVVFIPMILSPYDEIDGAFTDKAFPLENEDGSYSRVVPMGKSTVATKSSEVPERTEIRRGPSGTRYEDHSAPFVQRAKLPMEKPDRKVVSGDNAETKTELAKTAVNGSYRPQNRSEPNKDAEVPERAKPTVSKQQKPVAWAVQVGSFVKRNNALGLRDLLRKKGYRAFVEFLRGDSIGVTRTRVFVGPVLHRGNALQLAEKLRSDLSIDGIVVRYASGG